MSLSTGILKPITKDYISIDRLDIDIDIDINNPRFGENTVEDDFLTLQNLCRSYSLAELAESLVANGYFDEEPLIAIPKKEIPHKFRSIDRDKLRENKNFITCLVDSSKNRETIAQKV